MNEANVIPDLVTLADGRQGRRTLLPVTASAPSGEKAPVLDFIASNGTLDRYHEIIEPAGWRLESYRRNPVFQNAHQYGDILFTLGRAVVTEVRGESLYQRVEFAVDVNPVARIAYGLYKGGFLNAVSVGFIPVRWENGSAESLFRRKFLEQELLEVSAVAIPANPDALALGLKSGAIGKADLEELLALAKAVSGEAGGASERMIFNFARELRGLMRRA